MKTINRFHTYFKVTIRHSYFKADTTLEQAALSIAPDAETARALHEGGFVFRPSHTGFSLVGRSDQTLPDQMIFALHAGDPMLFLITSHDGAPLPPKTAINLHVSGDAQKTTLANIEASDQREHRIGRLVVEHAETSQEVDWFLPSMPVGHDFVLTAVDANLDLSQCDITQMDGSAILAQRSKDTLPDGRAAMRIALQGLRPLHERPAAEDQLVLHYVTLQGAPKTIVLPALSPNTVAIVNGEPRATAYVTI